MSGSTRADEWLGDRPFFLAIRQYGEERSTTIIDLDEHDWATTYSHLMRVPGAWFLCSKKKSVETGVLYPVLVMQVEDGDQPYFTTKHVGIMSFGLAPGPETLVYGIGKKRYNGEVQRMWVLPNGSMCSGEDVYWIADWMNKGKL